MKPKRRPEKFALRVTKGALVPADGFTAARLKERKYKINDVVFAELKKPRNPKFHRLAHQLGALVSQNIESFSGTAAHNVLKRLQLETNIGCDEVAYLSDGYGFITQRIPLSLSFESMDEGEFHEVLKGMCRHIADKYWPTLDSEEIASMAELMVDE